MTIKSNLNNSKNLNSRSTWKKNKRNKYTIWLGREVTHLLHRNKTGLKNFKNYISYKKKHMKSNLNMHLSYNKNIIKKNNNYTIRISSNLIYNKI